MHPVDWNDPNHPLAQSEPRHGQRAVLAATVLTPQGPLLCYCLHMEVCCPVGCPCWLVIASHADNKTPRLGVMMGAFVPKSSSTFPADISTHIVISCMRCIRHASLPGSSTGQKYSCSQFCDPPKMCELPCGHDTHACNCKLETIPVLLFWLFRSSMTLFLSCFQLIKCDEVL